MVGHITCCKGVLQHTLWLLICAVKSYGIEPAHINEYLHLWEWPQSTKGVTTNDMFSPKRVQSDKEAKTVNCSMSKALGAMPILRHWVRTVALRTAAATGAVLNSPSSCW